MVFILGIDIPIIAFFSFVAIVVTVILLIALIAMLLKGGKLIKEAEEVIDEEEKIHHIHLHQKKVSKPAAKKGMTLYQRWDSYWKERKKELFNQPGWTEHKQKVSKIKPVIAKKQKPVKTAIIVKKEKQPKKKIRLFEAWNNYWNKQKKDLDEGMKPVNDENEEG